MISPAVGQVDHLLTTTKAVRKRLDLDRPVDPDLVTECLRIATHAPSAGNTQPWRWVVVTDAAKRAEVAGFYRRAMTDYRAEVAAAQGDPPPPPPDPTRARMLASTQYLYENLHRAPVLVIACHVGRPEPDAGNRQLSGFYGSVLPAVWSFQLALRSRGLGSAWTNVHLRYEAEVGALLGIPDSAAQVALLPVAHTLGTDFTPSPRQPVDEVTFWNEWPSGS